MDIEFDAAKDRSNRAKHGVPLAIGRIILENRIGDEADPRRYESALGPEQRRVAYGLVAERLFVAVYTLRGETYRLISVRKANTREQRKWQSSK